MIQRLLILSFLLGIIGLSTSYAQKVKPLEGIWTGVGYQIDGDVWTMEVIHDTEEKNFKVSYPSLGCSGQWILQEKRKGRYVFLEKIDKGYCDQDVRVVVTQIDETFVSVAFFLDKYSESPIAYTVLEKGKALNDYSLPKKGT